MEHIDRQSASYWQIAPAEKARLWEDFKKNSIAAVGWNEMKFDLTGKTEEELMAYQRKYYPNETVRASKVQVKMLYRFLNLKIGDKIITNRGRSTLLGIGVVKRGYKYRPERDQYRHTVNVNYLMVSESGVPIPRRYQYKYFGKTICSIPRTDFEEMEQLVIADRKACEHNDAKIVQKLCHGPVMEDFEAAYRMLAKLGDELTIDNILHQMECNFASAGKRLSVTWKEEMEENVRNWSKRNA